MYRMNAGGRSAGLWTSEAIQIMQRIQETQSEQITTAAQWSAEAIASGGLVHLFGSGHSRMAVEEMFPRYGSFPGFNPLVELSTTFHTQIVGSNGQRQAMFIERVSGLAEQVLANFAFGPNDVLVVFSVSGTSALPIEMAQGAKARGLRVVAVTSVAHSQASEAAHGVRLLDVSDLVIDICTEPGDALVKIADLEPVGPGSTAATVTVVNEIKVQTADLLMRRGIRPPVLTAAAVVGRERSAQLFEEAYDSHSTRIAKVLGGVAETRRTGAVTS